MKILERIFRLFEKQLLILKKVVYGLMIKLLETFPIVRKKSFVNQLQYLYDTTLKQYQHNDPYQFLSIVQFGLPRYYAILGLRYTIAKKASCIKICLYGDGDTGEFKGAKFKLVFNNTSVRTFRMDKKGRNSWKCEIKLRYTTFKYLANSIPIKIVKVGDEEKEIPPLCALLNSSGVDNWKDRITGINKKGFVIFSETERNEIQKKSLELFERVYDTLEKTRSIKLFALYGTLLGIVRDSALIPGDDDFDVGYLADNPDPKAMKLEMEELMKQLLLLGYNIGVGMNGAAFTVWDEKASYLGRLDVRPVWFEDGLMWARKHACLKLKVEDFLPLKSTMICNATIVIPNKPEAFLEAYYGEGWKIPDPSYSNENEIIPSRVEQKMKTVRFTYAELKRIYSTSSYRPQLFIKPLMSYKDLAELE
jgi:hypothetical protein